MDASATNADEHGAVAFFRDLVAALGSTWDQQAATPAQQVPAVLSQAWDSFEGNVAIQSEGQPPIDCSKGCATCCMLRVSATAAEIFLIARFIEATAPAYAKAGIDLQQRLHEADARTRGLDDAQRVQLRQRCPFIAQGACTIYKVRPLACRGHASHSRKACVDAAAGRVNEVPFSGPHRLVRAFVQSALQAVLRARGLAYGVYELNQALVLALRDPALAGAWQGGADPLATAAVDSAEDLVAMGAALDEALAA